ncbi:unnamed protein product, partial [marine sediment metagenome]
VFIIIITNNPYRQNKFYNFLSLFKSYLKN